MIQEASLMTDPAREMSVALRDEVHTAYLWIPVSVLSA